MSERRTEVTPELEQLLAPYWDNPDPLIKRIQEDLHRREKYPMQISLEQVAFHGWLCRLIGSLPGAKPRMALERVDDLAE